MHQEKQEELFTVKEMTDKKETKKVREGVPMTEKALAEHLKSFSDIEESIKFVDKPRHWKK